MNDDALLASLLTIIPAAPLLGLAVLSVMAFTRLRLHERCVTTTVHTSVTCSFVATVVLSAALVVGGASSVSSTIPILGDHASASLCIDALSLPFVCMTAFLSLLVGRFSATYLHRESGHFRFFFLFLLFVAASYTLFLGRSLHLLFVGWEFVGLTSVLLISFFYTRAETFSRALHAFFSYRVTDIGLVLALSLTGTMHEFETVNSLWEASSSHATSTFASPDIVAFLLLLSAMGKSSQFPFVRWLPRAMEGPTPSSAIFYGALSVHAGVYLMLRVISHTPHSVWLHGAMVVIGTLTAVYATAIGRTQTDVKGSLAYASMTQVGIMFLEIGLGFRGLVVLHFVGHAALRTSQLLNASAVLHRHHEVRGWHETPLVSGRAYEVAIPASIRNRWYSKALRMGMIEDTGRTSATVCLRRISRVLHTAEDRVARRLERVLEAMSIDRPPGARILPHYLEGWRIVRKRT